MHFDSTCWEPANTMWDKNFILLSTGYISTHCCWSLTRRYISSIYVYNLPWLCTMNISRPDKRNWFHTKTRSRQYFAEAMTNTVYTDDLAILVNKPPQAKSLLLCLKQAVGGIDLHVNTNKTEFMCFKQGTITTLNSKPLKFVDQFTYLSSNISFTQSDVNICIGKAETAIGRLLIIWKSDLSDKSCCCVSTSIWMHPLNLMKHLEKTLDVNYTKMLCAFLNKSWKLHPTKQQPYLLSISQTIQVR